uniref:Ig-like domain-containing protein n=1 Tax=Buteo japonicus TaxID=224669 RepID=A0A8C0ASN9_9AVES
MWRSSRAGAKGCGGCGRGRLPSVLGAAWQDWPGPPRGGCLAAHLHARRGQAAGEGWHHKLKVTLPHQTVSGWGWQIVCPGQPLPALLTLFPAVLTLPAGSSATFFCNISMENDSGLEYSLNWYKETNHSQAQKIAEISRNNPQTKTEKYLLTNHTPAFKIEILNLYQNDSGSYYCGLIAFFEPNKVMESSRSHLVVTDEPEMEEGSAPNHSRAVLVGILLLTGVVVLLILGYLTVMHRRGGTIPHRDHAALRGWGLPRDLMGDPPMVSISTVDYGVLEFQCDQRTQVPPETRLVDQTEYATIGWGPSSPGGVGRDRLPRTLAPTTVCSWEK